MNTAPVLELPRPLAPAAPAPAVGAAPRRGAAYLRQYRAQPRRGARPVVLAALVALAALLFLKVWERTQANALSMERDRLSADVRALENRIQLSTELADQAALREGLSFTSLKERGFESPDPARVVEIDLPSGGAPGGDRALAARIERALRRILPARGADQDAAGTAALPAGIVP